MNILCSAFQVFVLPKTQGEIREIARPLVVRVLAQVFKM